MTTLPPGTRLLHIGPPKTGTTTLQAAFHAKRDDTLAQGVRYAGRTRHSASAVQAVTGRPSFFRDKGSPPIRRWNSLVNEVRSAREPRVLISSEFFADAEPPVIPRIIEDLGGEAVHVVVTLRPLARIIPSQWQQYVQSTMRVGFEDWLDGIFNDPGRVTPTFWRRHRHDALVARWAAATSPERMTVVVIDEQDRNHIMRVFEDLLGLRSGTLVADEELVNRSMTLPEVEAVRAFNIAFKDAGLGNSLLHRVMHFGAATYMKERRPDPSEPRVVVPDWALARAAEVSREMVAAIHESGVRVIGDLDALAAEAGETPASVAAVASTSGSDAAATVAVSPEIAARMAMGVLIAGGMARGMTGDKEPAVPGSTWIEPADLARYPTTHLAGAVARRSWQGLARPVNRLMRRVGPPRS